MLQQVSDSRNALVPSATAESVADSGKSGSYLGRLRSLSDPGSLTSCVAAQVAISMPSSSSSCTGHSEFTAISVPSSSYAHVVPIAEEISAEKKIFMSYCEDLVKRTKPSLVSPRSNRRFKGILRVGSKEVSSSAAPADITPLKSRELKEICSSLRTYYENGYRVFIITRSDGSTIETRSISWLVERILDLEICQRLIKVDNDFAVEMGLLRFKVLDMDVVKRDFESIENLFRSTTASRRCLFRFLENNSKKLYRAAQQKLGCGLDSPVISDDTVREFYALSGLAPRLQAVSLEQQRNYLPLILQSPHRVLFESNAFMVPIPDSLHNDSLDLQAERSFIMEFDKDPRQCLDGKKWSDLLSHFMKIGKRKERVAEAIEEMVVRCVTFLKMGKKIKKDDDGVLAQLKSALPKDKKAANWEGIGALINAITEKYHHALQSHRALSEGTSGVN